MIHENEVFQFRFRTTFVIIHFENTIIRPKLKILYSLHVLERIQYTTLNDKIAAIYDYDNDIQ